MKILKKILLFIIIAVLTTTTLIGSTQKSSTVVPRQTVKVAVIISNFDDAYISLVSQSLEEIQKENNGKVEFTFFDGKGNQATQNKIIDSVLQNNFDLLLANLVDINATTVETTINKIKQKNVPVLLFNIAPFVTDAIKSYNKSFVVATDAEQSGILQGKLLVDVWNTDKKSIDKNGDGILQYVMLTSKDNTTLSSGRSKYSALTISNAGIEIQELALRDADGTQESARDVIEPLILGYGSKIEAIIANNDTLAIGAIQALQKYGYNTGDKNKFISVVGINGIPEAEDLIKKGFMTGTVVQDAPAMANALYTIGMNLVSKKASLEGTDYKFDETGVVIKMPYSEYTK